MSNFIEISINESDKWDKIVKSFKNFDVFYLSSYVKAFQYHGDGEPVLFYYEDINNRAINVVMKRDIAKCIHFVGLIEENTYFDLSSPYGYGGFLTDGHLTNNIVKEYEEYCYKKGYISEFIRFRLFGDYKEYFSGCVESYTKNIVRNLEIDLEDMIMDFEHKVRKNLKKANKANLSIEIDLNGSRINDFLKIYYGTMDRTNAKEEFYFEEKFFEKINEMKDNIVYFYVVYEGRIIATELVIYGSEYCYSYLGGTDCNYFNLRPNEFLKFEIIKWAKEKGLNKFILGGGYGNDDGIFQYKKSFAPNGIVDFSIGKKIFNQDKYNYLMSIRKEKNSNYEFDTHYFPRYRA